MTKMTSRWVDWVPYVGLAIAIILSSWSFIRSEQYRAETSVILEQTYEIERRASGIREKLVRILDYMQSSIEAGEADRDFTKEIRLLNDNMATLENIESMRRFLNMEDTVQLSREEYAEYFNTEKIYNVARYEFVLNDTYESKNNVEFSRERSKHDGNVASNILKNNEPVLPHTTIFAITLSAIIFVGLFMYQRASFVRRRDQLIRSFASLFVHMTRTRVTGLSLFVKRLRRSETPDPEMVAAADQATEELASINEGLLKIAHSGRSSRQEPLAATMATLLQNHGGDVRLDVKDDAGEALVPAPQFHLILDELVRNAQRAVAASGVAEPAITVRGHLAHRSVLGRRLILEVNDNGVGMRADILKEAKKPFFSTRAGAHVGLGLTGCAEMVEALRGKFGIKSTYGVGTSIRIVYPLS